MLKLEQGNKIITTHIYQALCLAALSILEVCGNSKELLPKW